MSFLLDTNVVSELSRPTMPPEVRQFLMQNQEDDFFISVVTLAEIRHGIALLPTGRRREILEFWLGIDLPRRFSGRIVDIDSKIAIAWGDLMAWSRENGANLQPMDGLIAATSKVRELTLVTRNIRDFRRLGLNLVNPWDRL